MDPAALPNHQRDPTLLHQKTGINQIICSNNGLQNYQLFLMYRAPVRCMMCSKYGKEVAIEAPPEIHKQGKGQFALTW